jgi:uncharacterized protein (DUF885 family)
MTEAPSAPRPRPRPRTALLALSLAAAFSACAEWKPPPPAPGMPLAPPEAPPPRRAVAKPPQLTPSARFDRLIDRLLDEWLAHYPTLGRESGLHDYDGKVADYSAQGIDAEIGWLKKAREALAAVDPAALSLDQALDRGILLGQIDMELFERVEVADYKHFPQTYEELFSVEAYIDRDYAPLEERGKRLLAHEHAALLQIPHVLENLVSPMSKPVLETAVKIFKGYAEYLRGDVVKTLKGVGTGDFQEDFAKTNEALAKQADALADHLQKVEVPKGDDSHVLGVERYKKLLLAQESLTLSLADFQKMGEADLVRNQKAYDKALRKATVKRPKAGELLAAGGKLIDSSRAFLVDKKLVTIPTDERAVVKETPPYMRWNAAFLNGPGPFETAATPAFFYLTLPDPTWKKREQEEYVMTYGTLLATAVHEVYPGHFLHGLWIKKAPTRTEKLLHSYSFTEGWAHYGEQMMIEEGFGAEDAQNRVGQLSDALLRDCRFLVSIGVHTQGMTLAQAEKKFVKDCHQDKPSAREQAVRATFDPGYFAYTLGKLQILALREEAKKKLGPAFSLRRFHDELLSHGAPPVPLIHDRVLADLAAPAK